MGFSWSLYFCQESALSLVRSRPGVRGATCLFDRGPPGLLGNGGVEGAADAFYVYVDNVGLFGSSGHDFDGALGHLVVALRCRLGHA